MEGTEREEGSYFIALIVMIQIARSLSGVIRKEKQ
jgi:hypothetical protein